MSEVLFEVEDSVAVNNTDGRSGLLDCNFKGARGQIIQIDGEHILVNFQMTDGDNRKIFNLNLRPDIDYQRYYFGESELDYFVGD